MRNRLYYYICIFVLLVILRPISHAKLVDDTRRTKREISVAEASQPQGNADYEREVNLEREERNNGDLEKDDTYHLEKRKISKRSANPDVQQSNAEKSIDPITNQLSLNEESDYAEEEAGEEMARQENDKDVETSDLKRLPRDVNVEKYTDQDERSSLYDDYETKDVAKRGVLDGPGDYEEVEDDSPGILDDTVALEERDQGERRETRENDSRVKRDQALSETFDKSEPSYPTKLEEPKIAENPLTDKISRVESSKNFNRQALASGDLASEIKESGLNEMIPRSSGSTENKEPTSIITLSNEDESSAEYGKRVEKEIQRKIDSIKEEIKRDIEAQQRIRDVEENNAKFDELRDQEEDEERQSFEGEPIEKRQIKRSIREIDAVSFSKRDDKKRCLKEEGRDKLQRRSSDISRPDTLIESENLKKRFAINRDKFSGGQVPSERLLKKKRERVRQTFLVNNDRTRSSRRSRSYASPSDRMAARPENELSTDFNSYHHADDGMLQASSSAGEDESNDGEQSPIVDHSNFLASLTGSSQELSPRLAREYKEAFGGLQSEPGGALARFKRIKRVLGGPDTKI
ncbi:caldesmon [Polyergus mexicanus]|uniref:caldesmon n=1 Tax=Polyergus mexicanus TaxID=615972 RepID=UPI0038B65738